MVKELLRENRDYYYSIVKEESPEKRHGRCGCLAKSDMVPISCVDDLQAGDCRAKGYKANMKLLGDVKDMCLSIANGTPTHSGAKTIAFAHAVLGSALAWVEQLKVRSETLAASYIRHEEANQFCIKVIIAMESNISEAEDAVCKAQAVLGYTGTQQNLERFELGKDLPLVFLQ